MIGEVRRGGPESASADAICRCIPTITDRAQSVLRQQDCISRAPQGYRSIGSGCIVNETDTASRRSRDRLLKLFYRHRRWNPCLSLVSRPKDPKVVKPLNCTYGNNPQRSQAAREGDRMHASAKWMDLALYLVYTKLHSQV
jgi:hypothetical protein